MAFGTNTLGIYDPIFYAQEALVQLEKALGLAGRVHRGYDSTPQQLGSTIQIRRPGIFTATAMPDTGEYAGTRARYGHGDVGPVVGRQIQSY